MAFKFCELSRIPVVIFPTEPILDVPTKLSCWDTPDFSTLNFYPDPIHFDENTVHKYFELVQRTPTSFGCTYLFLERQFLVQLFREEITGQTIFEMDENIFSYNIIMIPMYINSIRQWSLFKVDLRKQRVQFYDPSSEINSYTVYCNKLIEFVNSEAIRIKKYTPGWFPKPGKVKWTIQRMNKWKQQENTEDSGLLICAYAETILAGQLPYFNLLSLAQFRSKILFEIARENCISSTWYSVLKQNLEMLESKDYERKYNMPMPIPAESEYDWDWKPIMEELPEMSEGDYWSRSRPGIRTKSRRLLMKCPKRRPD